MFRDNTIVKRPPLIVEIVGPAGAGKTTLLQALNQPYIKTWGHVSLAKIKYIRWFIRSTPFLLATFLRQYRNGRWLTRKEAKLTLLLKAWHHFLRQQLPNNHTVTVFDHGPISKLGILCEFGPEIKNEESYEKLLDRLVNQWASNIDMVIWVDAPVATLAERIHKRNKWHEVKDKSEEEGYKFLAHHRRSLEEIIDRLAGNSGVKVLHFDTEQECLKQIVEKVVAEFDPERSQG